MKEKIHMHRYERIWLMFGGGTLVVFLVVLFILAFWMGMTPPSDMQVVNAAEVDKTPPFDKPGLHQVGPHEYDAVMIGFVFGFNPNVLEVPAGSTVNFKLTSKDVVHGFEIAGTNVNLMLLPGHVNTISYTFEKPGEYLAVCNEYCGTGHQFMSAKIIVK